MANSKENPRKDKLEWRWYLRVLRVFPGCEDVSLKQDDSHAESTDG